MSIRSMSAAAAVLMGMTAALTTATGGAVALDRAPHYTYEVIRGPAPYDTAKAQVTAMNDRRQVVGRVPVQATSSLAFRWTSGRSELLSTSIGRWSAKSTTANDLNNDGIAVGSATIDDREVPVVWSRPSKATALPLPAGATGGVAVAVNRHGQAVGTVTTPTGSKAVVWNGKHRVTVVPTPTNRNAYGADIAENGVALVGYTMNTDEAAPPQTISATYRSRTLTPLPCAPADGCSGPLAISRSGRYALAAGSYGLAMVYDVASGSLVRGGPGEFYVRDVLDDGTVLGDQEWQAALYQPNGEVAELYGYVDGLPDGWWMYTVEAADSRGRLLVQMGDGTVSHDVSAIVLTPRR